MSEPSGIEELSEDSGRAPKLDRPRFNCPNCQAFAAQEWTTLAYMGYGTPFYDDVRIPAKWKAAKCTSCDTHSVWRSASMVFPRRTSAPPPHGDMPPEARALYMEAAGVEQVSPRAAAALARAALENLLKSLQSEIPKARLDARIAALEGVVSQPLWEMLTVLRYVGNEALHGDTDDQIALVLDGPLAETAELLYEAINDTVEELIARPARAKATYERLPQGIRETAERKAKEDKR